VTALDFHPGARADLDAAVDYYDKQRKGLGLDFLSATERAATRISQNPLSFPLYQGTSIRRCVLRRFPYSIFFLPEDDIIWIVAIAHQKRRPDYWKHRTIGS
jgi:toxin ParE1/3/4